MEEETHNEDENLEIKSNNGPDSGDKEMQDHRTLEGETPDEIDNPEIKSDHSLILRENEIHGEENFIDTNTFQDVQVLESHISLTKTENLSKMGVEQSSKVKINHSHSSGDTGIKKGSKLVDINESKAKSLLEINESSSMKSDKSPTVEEVHGEFEINEVKSAISQRSKGSEAKANISSVKTDESRLLCSSNVMEDSSHTKTDSSSGNFEDKIKNKYPVIPKSMPSSVNVNPDLVIVKFNAINDTFASAFKVTTTISEIKKTVQNVLELEEDFIVLESNNIEAKDSETLADLGGQPFGKVTLDINTKRGEMGDAILAERIQENVPTLEVITVHLGEKDFYKDIVVEITNESVQKEWLGGYRNQLTEIEYHNAYTQTRKTKKVFEFDAATGKKIPLFFHRDTQTPFKLKTKKLDTVVNKATQMWRSDLYVPSKNDKIMTARPYSVFNNKDKNFIKNVVKIQRAVRYWIQKRRLKNLVEIQTVRMKEFKREQQQIIQEQSDKERDLITSAAYPVNRDDFYMLYLKVETWWKKEWSKICEMKTAEAKNAASVLLIEKEVELLEAIEKHKIVGKEEALKKEQMRFLERTSRPTVIRNDKGQLTYIDDLDTQKAREFKEIYSCLVRKNVVPKDRVDTLISVKNLFESHYMEYEYAADLISLIAREIELLGIGMKLEDLRGLHKRIKQLFLNFLQQKEFNPAASKYKKPNLPKTVHRLFQCSRCLKLLPGSKYPVHVRMKDYTQCKSCTWMQNIAHERVDMSPYLKLLKQVQHSEMQKCCYSAICFILQPIGMGYLTNVIWHGHSAISESSDVSKLQHVRWLPDVEWAPWNTILLNDQEAKLHISISDVFEFYDEEFVEKVRQRHILARKRFIPLLIMDHDIRLSGEWSNITDSGVFLHPSHAERVIADNDEYDTF